VSRVEEVHRAWKIGQASQIGYKRSARLLKLHYDKRRRRRRTERAPRPIEMAEYFLGDARRTALVLQNSGMSVTSTAEKIFFCALRNPQRRRARWPRAAASPGFERLVGRGSKA
jgi:hypothetical protein